jgi:hypothetical protein
MGAQCGSRNLEEEEAEEGSGRRRRSTIDFDERLGPVDESLEAQPRACGSRATGEHGCDEGQGGTAGDESARLRDETKTLYGNPGRGCGMKQAREAEGGASRREVVKTCGRNEAGSWELPRQWMPSVTPRRGKKPHGRTAPT